MSVVSYSRKVFAPITELCRDVCHYCTFAKTPRELASPYMSADAVLATARDGVAAGCKEILFTLGDKPELRYRMAREFLADAGFQTTIDYVEHLARLVFEETGLLPHINAGVMTKTEMARLKQISVSQGLMLENVSERLCEKGGPHFGSPDKEPQFRLQNIQFAGELQIPFTTGILIGIGETRAERLQSLQAIADLHAEFGHIQEVIIQNFRAKPDTKMSEHPEPDLEDLLWTVTQARGILGPDMPVQTPPNLNSAHIRQILDAGIDDWGGISPVTPDFVNPEAPWPQIEKLERQTSAAGHTLVERLAVYPKYVYPDSPFVDPQLLTAALRMVDSEGYARTDDWFAGTATSVPRTVSPATRKRSRIAPHRLSNILHRAQSGDRLDATQVSQLFAARGAAFDDVCAAANELRVSVAGDTVTYVVNRNINYTNICYFRCGFCGFSKGKHAKHLRGKSYNLGLDEIVARAEEAWSNGATEVCLQGGIHPAYTGDTYLEICRAIRGALPNMHIHAFSPLEVSQGAATLGIPVADFLAQLQLAGLNSLPGTAAEILDDDVRAVLCPDKISTAEWLDVIATAHRVGLPTTATIMFGHVDHPRHWAAHLLHLRDLQQRTGGITEFVPLPFVHAQTPLFLKGLARRGPTFREAVLMHAVARLVLHPYISNIQTSWTKMGVAGASACLQSGCNDLGGTLMNESISRAAGATHGQQVLPSQMIEIAAAIGRPAEQRATLYGRVTSKEPLSAIAV
ncbi:MAG: 5-amino-6-(D-ribitylamino)uracil--L-tyrosine 4-hydroxyphenyl transferase CofH [Woeseiaceae bacterium]